MAAEAEKRGLDKQPTYEEKIYFARLQILSQELSSAMQADSGKISDADVEEYYKKNESPERRYHHHLLLRLRHRRRLAKTR